jgi:ubiquinone biosynthesis protein COQ4
LSFDRYTFVKNYMAIFNRQTLHLDFLLAIKGAISLFRDPTQTESVYDIEDGLRNTKATQLALEFVKSDPAVDRIITERYTPPPIDIDALFALPEDSLGHIYAAYIKESNFDPNFYRKVEVNDDISYMFLRLRQTHDIWHFIRAYNDSPQERLRQRQLVLVNWIYAYLPKLSRSNLKAKQKLR